MRNEIVCSESEVWGFLNSLGAMNLSRKQVQIQKSESAHGSETCRHVGERSTPWSIFIG